MPNESHDSEQNESSRVPQVFLQEIQKDEEGKFEEKQQAMKPSQVSNQELGSEKESIEDSLNMLYELPEENFRQSNQPSENSNQSQHLRMITPDGRQERQEREVSPLVNKVRKNYKK